MTDQLDTSKLIPLDVTGLEPIDDKSKPLDVSALEPLDVSGLEPVDAPPVQPVAVAQPQAEPVSSVFAPAAGSSSQSYPAPTGVAPTQSAVPKTIWNQNDGTFHQKLKPSEPVGIVFNGKKMMATYNPVTNKFTTDIDDTSRVVGKKPVVRPAEFDRNAYSLDGMQPPADQIEMHDVFAKVEIDPSQVQAYTEGQGALRSIRNTAMRALPPTATSFAAFNAAGIPAAAWAGRVHPYLAPVGLVVGGGLAAMGAGAVTDLGVNAAFPLDETDELNQLLYPTENAITQHGVALAALRPSLKTLAGMATLQGPALAAGAKGAAINTALAGQHRLVEEISSDKPMDLAHVFDPKQMLNDAAVGGFLMHKATAMGKAFEYPGKVLGAKLSPKARPEDATQSTKDVRAANEPLDTSGLEPVAQGNVPPRPFPEGKTKFSELTGEEFKAIADWDAQYGNTHDNTGKPLNRDKNTVTVDVEIKDKPNAPIKPKASIPPGHVEPAPDAPRGEYTQEQFDAWASQAREWNAKNKATHWLDGSPKSAEMIAIEKRAQEELDAEEGNVPKPETTQRESIPTPPPLAPARTLEGEVPSRPHFKNGPGADLSPEAIAAHQKLAKEWDDKYSATHWSSGMPKAPLPKPTVSTPTATETQKPVENNAKELVEVETGIGADGKGNITIKGAASGKLGDTLEMNGDVAGGYELKDGKVSQGDVIDRLKSWAETRDAAAAQSEESIKSLKEKLKTESDPEKIKLINEMLNKKSIHAEHHKKLAQAAREKLDKLILEQSSASEPKESSPEVQLAHLREQRDRLAATQPEPGTTQEAQLKKLEKAVDDLEEKLKEPNSQGGLVRNEGFTPGEVEALQKLTLDSMKKQLADMESSGRGDTRQAQRLRDKIASREKPAGNEEQKDQPVESDENAPVGRTGEQIDFKNYNKNDDQPLVHTVKTAKGDVTVKISSDLNETEHSRIYKEKGGLIGFEMSGEGEWLVKDKQGKSGNYKSLRGVKYEGEMTIERAKKLAEEIVAENAGEAQPGRTADPISKDTKPNKDEPAQNIAYREQQKKVAELERQLARFDKQKPNKYTETQRAKIKATLDREIDILIAMPDPIKVEKPKKGGPIFGDNLDTERIDHVSGDKFLVYNKEGKSWGTNLEYIRQNLPALYDKALEARGKNKDDKEVEDEVDGEESETRNLKPYFDEPAKSTPTYNASSQNLVTRILKEFNADGVSDADKSRLITLFKSAFNESPTLLSHGAYLDAAKELGIKIPKRSKGQSPFPEAPKSVDDAEYRRQQNEFKRRRNEDLGTDEDGETGQGDKPKPKVTPPDAGTAVGPNDWKPGSPSLDPKTAPFNYEQVIKAFGTLQDIGDYKPLGGTKQKAAGRIENMVKQLEKIFPGIKDAVLKEGFSPNDASREEALAEPDMMAKLLSRYLSNKFRPYRDFAYEQKNAKDQPAEEQVELAEDSVPKLNRNISETKSQIEKYESIKNKEKWHKEELERLKGVLAEMEAADSAYRKNSYDFDRLGQMVNRAADAYNNSSPTIPIK